jgi:hypothetical protein
LSLTTGQKSSLLLLILTATWALLRAEKPFASGAIFGLIAFKPHLGIPIGLFMLVRRQWSFVMGCYFTVGCLIVASFLTGFEICSDYFGVTMGFTDYVHNEGYHLEQGFSLWSFWQLALQDSRSAQVATLISSLLVLGGTAFSLRSTAAKSATKPLAERLSDQRDPLARGFSAMTIATLLVAPHLYAYDLTMLLLPAVLLSDLAWRHPTDRATRVSLVALAIVLFGMYPLMVVAAATGWQLGVPLMLVAWVFVLRSTQDLSVGTSAFSAVPQTA